MTSSILGALGGLAMAGAGWVLFQFLGKPLREFFDLRREIHRQILAQPTMAERTAGFFSVAEMPFNDPEVAEGSRVINDLAAQLTAFSAGEPAAAMLLRRLGWNAAAAGTAAMRYAVAMRERDGKIERYREDVFTALRLRGDDPD